MTPTRELTPRATRYPLNLPVRYRTVGEERWDYGMTVNISHTGILLTAGGSLDVERPLDIEVVLPGDQEASARVVTRGIVRRSAEGGSEPSLAVALENNELVRIPRLASLSQP